MAWHRRQLYSPHYAEQAAAAKLVISTRPCGRAGRSLWLRLQCAFNRRDLQRRAAASSGHPGWPPHACCSRWGSPCAATPDAMASRQHASRARLLSQLPLLLLLPPRLRAPAMGRTSRFICKAGLGCSALHATAPDAMATGPWPRRSRLLPPRRAAAGGRAGQGSCPRLRQPAPAARHGRKGADRALRRSPLGLAGLLARAGISVASALWSAAPACCSAGCWWLRRRCRPLPVPPASACPACGASARPAAAGGRRASWSARASCLVQPRPAQLAAVRREGLGGGSSWGWAGLQPQATLGAAGPRGIPGIPGPSRARHHACSGLSSLPFTFHQRRRTRLHAAMPPRALCGGTQRYSVFFLPHADGRRGCVLAGCWRHALAEQRGPPGLITPATGRAQ